MTSDIQTIARGDASRILQMRRIVARSDEQWRALWAAHAGPGTEAPPVDFGARMVAAVFQGQRPSAGFETTIVGASADGPVFNVQVDERLPTTGGIFAQVLVSPFHIVSIPRFEGEVRFENAHQQADDVTRAVPAATRPDSTARISPAPGAAAASTPPSGSTSASVSSTGLSPETAGALAYLAGPLSGALLLIVERTNRNVRFHAWQALIGLGALGLIAFLCLGLAFLMLMVSPRIFSAMLWMAAIAAVAWVVLWAICLVQAYKGRRWKLPIAGAHAERLAGR